MFFSFLFQQDKYALNYQTMADHSVTTWMPQDSQQCKYYRDNNESNYIVYKTTRPIDLVNVKGAVWTKAGETKNWKLLLSVLFTARLEHHLPESMNAQPNVFHDKIWCVCKLDTENDITLEQCFPTNEIVTGDASKTTGSTFTAGAGLDASAFGGGGGHVDVGIERTKAHTVTYKVTEFDIKQNHIAGGKGALWELFMSRKSDWTAYDKKLKTRKHSYSIKKKKLHFTKIKTEKIPSVATHSLDLETACSWSWTSPPPKEYVYGKIAILRRIRTADGEQGMITHTGFKFRLTAPPQALPPKNEDSTYTVFPTINFDNQTRMNYQNEIQNMDDFVTSYLKSYKETPIYIDSTGGVIEHEPTP